MESWDMGFFPSRPTLSFSLSPKSPVHHKEIILNNIMYNYGSIYWLADYVPKDVKGILFYSPQCLHQLSPSVRFTFLSATLSYSFAFLKI